MARTRSDAAFAVDTGASVGPATSEPTTSWKCAALEIKTLLSREPELSAVSMVGPGPIAYASPVAIEYRQQDIRDACFLVLLVAVELRLSYLTQYANQDAGHSDPMRASGTWSRGRR